MENRREVICSVLSSAGEDRLVILPEIKRDEALLLSSFKLPDNDVPPTGRSTIAGVNASSMSSINS
jgi:hypothetical protein